MKGYIFRNMRSVACQLLLPVAAFGLLYCQLLLPTAAFSQVIPAPTIRCVTTDETDGDVTINWTNPTLDPCGPFVAYILMGGTSPTGPFFPIDTITVQAQTSAPHDGANGTILDWYYFMTMVQNCPGATQSFSDTVKEEINATPDLEFVTVTDSGVYIQWTPSTTVGTEGYVIYYDLPGTFVIEVDTVPGRTSNYYLDSGAGANDSAILYTIAGYDGCGNRSEGNPLAHNTIYLAADVQACVQQISLSWNEYINWSGVQGYQLETSTDGAPFTLHELLPDHSTGYPYSLSGVTGDTICFRITAVHQNGTTISRSNIQCMPLNLVRSTTFNYLRRVTVNAAGTVDLDWYIDSAADINAYYVLRSLDGTNFSPIDTIPVTNPQLLNSYTDGGAVPVDNSYHYEIASYDDCNFQLNSDPGQTIHLTGDNNGVINTIDWNAYTLTNATVLNYILYRIENGAMVPLQTLGPTELTFEDDIATAISEDGAFCYVIEANYTLDIPGIVTESLISTSNQFCLYQKPVVYVPNAFVPGGKNNYFKPTLLNPNVSDYEFLIFDRWGKEMFSTNVLVAGWDGTNNGESMPTGGYSYYIKVVSKGGEVQEKTGMVILVR